MSISADQKLTEFQGIPIIDIKTDFQNSLGFFFICFYLFGYILTHRVNCVYADDWAFLRRNPIRRIILQIGFSLLGVKFVYYASDPAIDFQIAEGLLAVGGAYYQRLLRIYSIIYRLSDLVLFPSRAYADTMVEEGVPLRKVFGTVPGVDEDLFNPLVSGSRVRRDLGIENRFVIGWIGHMNKFRLIEEVFIPLIEEVTKKIPDAVFLVIGDGVLRKKFASLALRNRALILLDFLAHEKTPEYYAASDVIISPLSLMFKHTQNALSIKVLEALAIGRPVVATKTKPSEVDLHDLDGVIWVDDRLDSFQRAILELWNNRDDFRRKAAIQAKNMQKYSEQYNAELVADKILSLDKSWQNSRCENNY